MNDTQVADCPLQVTARNITDLSKSMIKLLRKVRRDLQACNTCARGPDCSLLEQFGAQIRAAISEVWTEYTEMPTT